MDSDPVLVEWTAPPPTEAEVQEALGEIERLLEIAIFAVAPLTVLVLLGSSVVVGQLTGDGWWLPVTMGVLLFALGPMIGLYTWLRVMQPRPAGSSRHIQLRASGAWVNGRCAWARRAIISYELRGEARVVIRLGGWGMRSIELRLDPRVSVTDRLREAFRTLGVPERNLPRPGARVAAGAP